MTMPLICADLLQACRDPVEHFIEQSNAKKRRAAITPKPSLLSGLIQKMLIVTETESS